MIAEAQQARAEALAARAGRKAGTTAGSAGGAAGFDDVAPTDAFSKMSIQVGYSLGSLIESH